MPGKNQTFVWWVDHPEHTVAPVIAPNWEQATVEAAKWWEVPWKKVAATCSLKNKDRIKHGVCCECGGTTWDPVGTKVRCSKCEAIARQKEETQRARNRRFYSDMHRN